MSGPKMERSTMSSVSSLMSSVMFTSSPRAACASHLAMKRSFAASMVRANSVTTRRWNIGCIM